MPRSPTQHSRDSSAAAFTMWGNTADRTARLRNAHDNSPSGHNWHARRLFGQDVDLDKMTPEQWQQTADARLAWLKANSIKAIKARQRKRAAALREKAARMEAWEPEAETP